MLQVNFPADCPGHGQIRALCERPHERKQRARVVRDGEAAPGAGDPAADERPHAVGGFDGKSAR